MSAGLLMRRCCCDAPNCPICSGQTPRHLDMTVSGVDIGPEGVCINQGHFQWTRLPTVGPNRTVRLTIIGSGNSCTWRIDIPTDGEAISSYWAGCNVSQPSAHLQTITSIRFVLRVAPFITFDHRDWEVTYFGINDVGAPVRIDIFKAVTTVNLCGNDSVESTCNQFSCRGLFGGTATVTIPE